MNRFDVSELKSRLDSMFVLCRVAFAASCCERLIPSYQIFSETMNWGDPTLLRSAIAEVWTSLESGSFNIEKIRRLVSECEQILPDTEDFDSPFTSAALDAGTAVLDTLECCLDGDPQHALDVASFSRDTVDMILRQSGAAGSDLGNKIVANDPMMIKELNRQSEDLQTLGAITTFDGKFVRLFKSIVTARGSSILPAGNVDGIPKSRTP